MRTKTPLGVTPVTTAAKVSPIRCCKRHSRNALIHHPFHFARRILLESAVPRNGIQLLVRIRRRLLGQDGLDQPLRSPVSAKRRFGAVEWV